MSSAISSAPGSAAAPVRLCITLPTVDQQDALDEIHVSHSPARVSTAANANANDSQWPLRTPSTNDVELQQGRFRLGSPWTAPVATVSLPTADQLDALHELEAARLNSALHPARRRDPTASPNPAIAATTEHRDRRRGAERHQESEETSVEARSLIGGIKPASSLVRVERRKSFQSKTKKQKRPNTISYAPETLQSVFQSAKPRVYKSTSRTETPVSTRQVAVVTTTIGSEGTQDVYGHTQQSRTNAVPPWISHHQHHHAPGKNTHVAIVTLTDEVLAARLMLDFRASNCKSRSGSAGPSQGDGLNQRGATTPISLAWSLLDSEHQSLELMAASRSRSVVANARAEEITVPPVAAFSHSIDVKTQLAVRSFTRWFLATQHSRQRVREAFLEEELQFAARDASVVAALRRAGRAAIPEESISDADSRQWIDFTVWYATGQPYPAEDHFLDYDGMMQLQTERLHDRVALLRKRLAALEAYDKYAASTEPPSAEMFIFDSLPSVHDTTAADSPSNWDKLSRASQEKELALALLDPVVQIAAIADDVELPDGLVATMLPYCDFLTLAAPFIAWWVDAENIHRQEFLTDEINEASADETVLETLRSDASHEDAKKTVKPTFMDGYFASATTARVNFLTTKLERLQRNDRVAAITQQGQLPAPILLAAPFVPLLVPFEFPPPLILAANVVVDELTDVVASGRLGTQRSEQEGDAKKPVVEEEIADDDEASRRRQEEERLLMEVEDALSSHLRLEYESASDDEQEIDLAPIESPKRTDFTYSYFFRNLPKSYRINSGGWLAGSGIDNGDEEIEEEERLERERKHQENLDRLEAERLAELDREAERQRLEKEMDEKALQLRRIRQHELKKILIRQAELEQQRAVQDEFDRMMRGREEMAREEQEMRAWLAFIEHERAAIEAEDGLARQIAMAERDARRREMRRVLAELTLMDMEDRRSAAAQAELLALERKQKKRIEYLTDLYEQFEPYYPASGLPSEEMLPVIRHRLDRKQLKHKRTPAKYAMSLAEALAVDEVEEEQHYVARDSRKLRQLLGLPVTTPQSRRMMKVPSEQEIIKTRHELELMLPPSSDFSEEDRTDRVENQSTRPRDSLAADRFQPKTRLPELVHWKARNADGVRLSDLREEIHPQTNQHSSIRQSKPKPKPAAATSSPPRQLHTALPFFRGNFIVEGKARAQAYAPQNTAAN